MTTAGRRASPFENRSAPIHSGLAERPPESVGAPDPVRRETLRVCPIRGRIALDKGKRGLAPGPERDVKLGEKRVGRVPVPVFRAIGAIAGMRLDTLMGQTPRGYPVTISCNFRYLNGAVFFDSSGFNNISMR